MLKIIISIISIVGIIFLYLFIEECVGIHKETKEIQKRMEIMDSIISEHDSILLN